MVTAEVVLATLTSLLQGAMLTGLLAGAGYALLSFHRAGLARLQEDTHVARLRPGMRPLTSEEARELVRRQRALEEASEAWLSPAHRGAREQLVTYVAQLADDQVPLSQLADAMGVRKQRAHQQVQAGRDRLGVGAPS